MFVFGTQFFKNMDYKSAGVDDAIKLADDKQARNLNATDTDLKKFHKSGGKLILYHGWSDAAIPPLRTVDDYTGVEAAMGEQATHDFVPTIYGGGNAALRRWSRTKRFCPELGGGPRTRSLQEVPRSGTHIALSNWSLTETI